MRRLVLVDGLSSEARTALWHRISREIKDFRAECSLTTTSQTYAQHIGYVLDDISTVYLRSSWVMQRLLHSVLTDPIVTCITQQNLQYNRYRILDRMALGANLISHFVPINYDEFYTTLKKEQGAAFTDELAQRIHDASFRQDPLKFSWSGFEGPINLGPGIGAFRPGNILIIGDRHGPAVQPYTIVSNVPFCAMSGGTGCSDWLNWLLEANNISEHDLYWINAYNRDARATDPHFIDRLEPSKVFALGESANRWCQLYHIDCEYHYHPQFWKRFHFKKTYPFITSLIKAVSKMCKV